MLMKTLIVLHRYLGVALGLLMLLWCLSGFVMMYEGYPQLTAEHRLMGLRPLMLTPAQARAPIDLPDDATVQGFSLQMMADRPTLQLSRGPIRREAFDLTTGAPLEQISAAQALDVARAFQAGNGIGGRPTDLGVIDVNQWTLNGINRAGPMRRIRFGDGPGTEIYVAEQTGEVVQHTDATQRLIAWFGAIPHWIYPTVIRKDPGLWNAVVVGTSSIGVFLTAFGIYLGIVRFRKYKSGRWSPYRGWFYWHHVIGLVFGLLTLTWVLSGLFTMSPWGLFESEAGRAERQALAGTFTGADVKGVLKLTPAVAMGGIKRLESAPFGGKLYLLATLPDGAVERLDSDGRLAPLGEDDVRAALQPALGGRKLLALERIETPDAYYYDGYDRKAAFPAFRARLGDKENTILYLDGTDGRLLRAVDGAARQSRFWREGLHDFDFAFMRARPLWDIIVWILLGGVTVVCATGLWLAVRRIGIDLAGLKARVTPAKS